MYYHGARYYAPWLCRWTAPDPAGMVDGVNLYEYVKGNPVRLRDPDGMESDVGGGESTEANGDQVGVQEVDIDEPMVVDPDERPAPLAAQPTEESDHQNEPDILLSPFGTIDRFGFWQSPNNLSEVREQIAENAREKIGSEVYRTDREYGDFQEDSNKCNVFVADVLDEASVSPGDTRQTNLTGYAIQVIADGLTATPGGVPNFVSPPPEREFVPPLAGDWADPDVELEGWEVIDPEETTPMPGDVAAEPVDYSDATGHVAIVVSEDTTVGTDSNFHGLIRETDWGFRTDGVRRGQIEDVVFRRFVAGNN